MARKSKRKSKMTPAELEELDRRLKAGDDMSVPFSLTTGKPINLGTAKQGRWPKSYCR